jgi:uncharacterized cofD-like protein
MTDRPARGGAPAAPARIVLLTGGSAARSLTMALARAAVAVTRVVPAWDSGGSSKPIRAALGLMPVGDIRQALLTMASGEGRSDDLVRLCNTRLSDENRPAAEEELAELLAGNHPLLADLDTERRTAIRADLERFAAAVGPDFDWLNGSVGNFILAGAMLRHGRDCDAGIAAFRDLCGIRDRVLPATGAHDAELTARLRDGSTVDGQHRITGLERARAAIGIETVALARPAAVHPGVAAAIADADVIAFGPGSFFTSILPHLLVDGLAAAVAANQSARKLFLANLVECNETTGRTLDELLDAFAAAARARGVGLGDLVGEIHVDRQPFPAGKTTAGHAYLGHGRAAALARDAGIAFVYGALEDPWQRGRHDGAALARVVTGATDG